MKTNIDFYGQDLSEFPPDHLNQAIAEYVGDLYGETNGEQWQRIHDFAERLNLSRDDGDRLIEVCYCELDPPMREVAKMMSQLGFYWLSDAEDPVRDAIQNCDFNQGQLSARSGVGRDILSRFMRSQTDIRLSTFDKLNEHVGLYFESLTPEQRAISLKRRQEKRSKATSKSGLRKAST